MFVFETNRVCNCNKVIHLPRSNMKNIQPFQLKILAFIFYVGYTFSTFGQIPTHIEPGQDQKSVDLYTQPEYIIPILTLFVVLIGYYFWRRNRKK